MAVNPKKLRPYDEPPRIRVPFLPDAPDSAATGFLVASALWLAAATGIGALLVAQQLFGEQLTFGLEIPVLWTSATLSVEVSPATVDAGFWNALVFGWLSNVALAAIFFATPRLLGRRLVDEPLAYLSMGAWNVAVAAGMAAVYLPAVADAGRLAEFPLPVDGLMLLALLLANDAFWRTVWSARGELPYVGIMFFGTGLLAALGLYALGSLAPLVPLSDAQQAFVTGFYGRALLVYWIGGAAYGTLFYVIPRATGNPLHSAALGQLGWISWLMLGGLSALTVLTDASIPTAVPLAGEVATMLLVVPAFLAAANLLLTIRGRWTLALSPGTLQFALVAVSFLGATALFEAIGALRPVGELLGGTAWETGVLLFGLLGTATFAGLALIEHAAPRLLRRSWSAGLITEATLWGLFAGAALTGFALMAGGLAEGSLLAQAAPAEEVEATLFWFRGAAGAGIGLAGLGALALLLNLFLMYSSGRPADHAIPAASE